MMLREGSGTRLDLLDCALLLPTDHPQPTAKEQQNQKRMHMQDTDHSRRITCTGWTMADDQAAEQHMARQDRETETLKMTHTVHSIRSQEDRLKHDATSYEKHNKNNVARTIDDDQHGGGRRWEISEGGGA